MKLPAEYKSISLYTIETCGYPPLGFCPFWEHEYGNGDLFGLYWPIGFEDRDPIVAEIAHDSWAFLPSFSSLERFLAAVQLDEEDDDEWVDTPPTLEFDPLSPLACLQAARSHLKSQNVGAAVECLETAARVLPEYTEAQALLCSQYRRLNRHDDAVRAAIQAIISPPSLGGVPSDIAQWLARQSACPAELETDPIWISRKQLTLNFGGVKENAEYAVLRSAIDAYLQQSAFIPAMTLMQTFAEYMTGETISFKERQGFDGEEYVAWQLDVAATQYGKSRLVELPEELA